LHIGAGLALVGFFHFSLPPTRARVARVTMLQEGRLIAPRVEKPSVSSVRGTDSGNRNPHPASKGELPKPANLRLPVPLRVQNLKPLLKASPSIIDSEPPKIAQDFQYGTPLAQTYSLSPGPGWNGLGNGSSGSGSGLSTARSGRGLGSRFRTVVYHMSELSKVPELLYKVAPDYSDEARAARCHGTVLLAVIIDEKGTPTNIHVLKPLGLGLDQKAIEAVQHWRFSPGIKDGKPVCVAANVEVNFQLL
jgi:protein TonB